MTALKVFALAAGLCLALAACEQKPAAKAGASRVLPVATMVAKAADEPLWLATIGSVEELQAVTVKPRATGILLEKTFTEGALIHENDVLFRLDRASLQASVDSAAASVRQNKSLVAQNQRERDRLARMRKSDAATQKEVDNANSALEQSKAALAAALAKESDARISLGYADVRAPASGFISRALVDNGSLVTANSTSLATISVQDAIKVRWGFSEMDLAGKDIRPDSRVLVYINGSKTPVEARLDYIARTIDAASSTRIFRAVLPASVKLTPGQMVRIRLEVGSIKQAFRIPIASVKQLADGTYAVFVLKNGKAVQTPVKVAHWVGTDWVLTGGIATGDKVITDQLIRLKNGAAVREASAPKK